ncbi:glutathione S-transferase [Rhizobiales bacterium GAS191]|nr:glutathione S-transferase [Rhizobiales bacterium GAS191]
MTKLYYSPGTCALGVHILLEEIGKPYESQLINIRTKEQFDPKYVEINPKSKVPALQRDDGSVLTEFPAIAFWLARAHPDSKLLPDDLEGQVRSLEAMDYLVATVHMQGFVRMLRPENFAPNAADHDAVKARGRDIFAKGLELVDRTLAGKNYLAGTFSIADAALFYIEFWAATRVSVPLPDHCQAHYERLKSRSSVKRALQAQELTV